MVTDRFVPQNIFYFQNFQLITKSFSSRTCVLMCHWPFYSFCSVRSIKSSSAFFQSLLKFASISLNMYLAGFNE
ncbi:hypothetical protein V3C99_017187 [Haemonchus contortus]|uniref:Ovule protein n=1 Tax=Haemonchus contortus TaxID=6289 RepID=A0A7I4Z8A6_HAECO